MIMTSVKLRTSEASTQKHEWESSCSSRAAYFIFPHACTEMATFFAWNAGRKSPFWRTHENVSQKIQQRQFCTNCRFSQRWSWLPILPSFRNELTFWSVRWRHLMVQKMTKNYWLLPHFSCVSQKGDFLTEFQAKKVAIFVHAWENKILGISDTNM